MSFSHCLLKNDGEMRHQYGYHQNLLRQVIRNSSKEFQYSSIAVRGVNVRGVFVRGVNVREPLEET